MTDRSKELDARPARPVLCTNPEIKAAAPPVMYGAAEAASARRQALAPWPLCAWSGKVTDHVYRRM
jgi:hypothetical protein